MSHVNYPKRNRLQDKHCVKNMYQQSAEKFILWNEIKLYNKQQRDVMENNIHRLYCDTATLVDQKITGNSSDTLVDNKTTMKISVCDT